VIKVSGPILARFVALWGMNMAPALPSERKVLSSTCRKSARLNRCFPDKRGPDNTRSVPIIKSAAGPGWNTGRFDADIKTLLSVNLFEIASKSSCSGSTVTSGRNVSPVLFFGNRFGKQDFGRPGLYRQL